MLSGKRPYWKIAMLLSSGLIFLLGACGDLVTEEEIAGEEGKGDTQTGILSKSYSNLDSQYALATNPKIISVPERGRATAIRVSANVSFYFDGYFAFDSNNDIANGISANITQTMKSKIIRHGTVLGELQGEITANCPTQRTMYSTKKRDYGFDIAVYRVDVRYHNYYSDGPCEHKGTLTLTLPGNNQFLNGEWELGEIEFVDGRIAQRIREFKSNWTIAFDYTPTLTSQHKNLNKLHLPDSDKRYEVYGSINIPPIYSGPLSGGRSGILINVDIAHNDPKDLVIELEHNDKSVTLLELAHATQVQNGLQRRFSLSDVPELSTFVGEDMAGEWRLWLVDETRGYDGDLNWWSLELTPSASK